jgi:hypothetical protein
LFDPFIPFSFFQSAVVLEPKGKKKEAPAGSRPLDFSSFPLLSRAH